jgi:hypothetical protein
MLFVLPVGAFVDEGEAGQHLRQILEDRDGSIPEPAILEALLRDYFPDEPGDVSVLLAALSERVPQQLRSDASVPAIVLRSHLEDQLSRNRRIDRAAAKWAIAVWSAGLGIKPEPYVATEHSSDSAEDRHEKASPQEFLEEAAPAEEGEELGYVRIGRKLARAVASQWLGRAGAAAGLVIVLIVGIALIVGKDAPVVPLEFAEGKAYWYPNWYTFSSGWRVTGDKDSCWTEPPSSAHSRALILGIGRSAGPLLAMGGVNAAKLPEKGFSVRANIFGATSDSVELVGLKENDSAITAQVRAKSFFDALSNGDHLVASVPAIDVTEDWPLSTAFSLLHPATWERAIFAANPSDAFRAWQLVEQCANIKNLPLTAPPPPPPPAPDPVPHVQPPQPTVDPSPQPNIVQPIPPLPVVIPPGPSSDRPLPPVGGRVTVVFDSNAIEIMGRHQPINLDGVLPADPALIPRISQDIGRYLIGTLVWCYARANNKYYCEDTQNRDIAELAVRRGLAMAADGRYLAAQRDAQASRVGIWMSLR